ncbi:aspartyl/asparaginyl beta-hydroxylase domain-containing protein [Nostoc sp.]|uniref:aspartyl/asparaginyl beta-hydroxylase domain-containing protein n=1 Tax=Nostoc sp. TaxID=1180 RepID=UPI002FFCCA7F
MVVKYDIKMLSFLFYINLLKLFYRKGNLNRFENAIKSYINLLEESTSNHSRKTSDFVYPGITHKPWYKPDDHMILNFVNDKLTQGFSDIKSEWLAYSSGHNLVSRFNASDLFTSLKKDDWKAYLLWKEGKFTQIGLSAFPKTVSILSKLEHFVYPLGHIEFYVMKPGVALPPHRDLINIAIAIMVRT